jgi:crossover junction endodeoxyribonuclease RuvC
MSLTSTGIAVWERITGRVNVHRIRSTGSRADTWDDRLDRLRGIVSDVYDLINVNSLVVVESPAYSSNSGSATDRAGIWWLTYSELHGIGCTIVPVAPTAVKKFATGKGNADKDTVLAAVIRRYPDINVTGNDEADAVALLDIGMHLIGQPLAYLPALNRTVLDKLTLPETRHAA